MFVELIKKKLKMQENPAVTVIIKDDKPAIKPVEYTDKGSFIDLKA